MIENKDKSVNPLCNGRADCRCTPDLFDPAEHFGGPEWQKLVEAQRKAVDDIVLKALG